MERNFYGTFGVGETTNSIVVTPTSCHNVEPEFHREARGENSEHKRLTHCSPF
jgi:hypothetical protein